MNEASIIEIDAGAIDHNLQLIRHLIGPECRVCPVVKADAYGLGLDRIAPRLTRGGADMLAVVSLDEAARVIATGAPTPILVLMPVREAPSVDTLYRPLMSGRLQLVVHDLEHAGVLQTLSGQMGIRLSVHVKVDTGMGRGGCPPEEALEVITSIERCPRMQLTGIMTHFASPECDADFTTEQLRVFGEFLDRSSGMVPAGCVVHASGTYAALRDPRYHLDMVRVGLAWVGYGIESVDADPRVEAGSALRPCFRWVSRVIQIKRLRAGQTVGYGRRWTAARDTVAGVVPVGYADGYPRCLGGENGAPVRIAPDGAALVPAPIIGAVSMDQMTVDLTDVLAQAPDGAGLEWPVELIANDPEAPNALPALARRAGTIPHEILCGLSPSIPRVVRASRPVVDPVVKVTSPRAARVR